MSPLPASVHTGEEELMKAYAECTAACSRVFQSRLPTPAELAAAIAHVCACSRRACVWGLGEGAVPRLSHASPGSCGSSQTEESQRSHPSDSTTDRGGCGGGPQSYPLQRLLPYPAPHLEQLLGEVAAVVEALQVSDEVPAGHAFPNVLREKQRLVSLRNTPLKTRDRDLFSGFHLPHTHTYSRDHGDLC